MLSLTVVIPTHNRHDILKQVLLHLADGSVKPDEVIVVDDGSEPAVTDIIDVNSYGMSRVAVLRHNLGRGAAAARNAGARAATGDIIVFIDDDVFPDRHCLRYHKMIHQQNSAQAYGVMGRIYFDPDLPRTPLMHYLEEVGNFVAVSKGEDRNVERRGLISANFSLKRAFLEDKEVLFNEEFPYSQTEDTEFGVRMIIEGWDLHYHIAPSARHHSPFTMSNFFDKAWQGGVSKAYWALHQPENTMFVSTLLTVIRRKSREERFRVISSEYVEFFGEEALENDMKNWDRFTYDKFLTWMRNSMEWWRDLGIYDGWLRYIPAFAQISEDVQRAFDRSHAGERLPLLRSAWQHDKEFLPMGLLLSDQLAKAGNTDEAISVLSDLGDLLPVLERLMRLQVAAEQREESILLARRIYDRARSPILTHQKYKQMATAHIMTFCKRGQLDPTWAIHVWNGLGEHDLLDLESWIRWLRTEVELSGSIAGNTTIETLLKHANGLHAIERDLRTLCDGHVDFMEYDGTRSGMTSQLPTDSRTNPSHLATSRGMVTWYCPQKGFGFIRSDEGGCTLFVHQTSFRNSQMQPQSNLSVSYVPYETSLGLEAREVYLAGKIID